jgi:hypothetical protein
MITASGSPNKRLRPQPLRVLGGPAGMLRCNTIWGADRLPRLGVDMASGHAFHDEPSRKAARR